jgi:hypothetical protein
MKTGTKTVRIPASRIYSYNALKQFKKTQHQQYKSGKRSKLIPGIGGMTMREMQ